MFSFIKKLFSRKPAAEAAPEAPYKIEPPVAVNVHPVVEAPVVVEAAPAAEPKKQVKKSAAPKPRVARKTASKPAGKKSSGAKKSAA